MSRALVGRPIAAVAAALACIGCETMAGSQDRPAIITEPGDASRSALQRAVSEAVGVEVMLADDALTESSILILSRNMPRDIEGSPAQGRIMEPPLRFRLVKSGEDCVLIDERDASRYRLADTTCVEDD